VALERIRRALPALIGLALFVVALVVLRRELEGATWREIARHIRNTPGPRLAIAALLTAANYGVLTCYDFLAFAYAGRRMPWRRIAPVSFLAYAIANNVGFAMLSGASVRYRFYTRWGITAEDLSRIVFSYVVSFWLGLLLLGGLSLAVSSLPDAVAFPGRAFAAPIGWTLAAASVAYVGVSATRRTTIRLGAFTLPLPSPQIAAAQLALSAVDWTLAAAVLYSLLPVHAFSFAAFLGAFLTAQLLGVASHVPGGAGVFESVMVLLLKPYASSGSVLPALLVYRAIYYLLPLAVALVGLVADELHQRREQAARVSAALGRLTEVLAPRLVAFFTFLCGAILLFSGATPSASGRLSLLERFLPLGIVEVSHFTGSVVGAALLLLSHGLARRLDAAYHLTVAAIVVGIVASLLKGADYEEALVLWLVLVVLARARPAFDRRAAFFDASFSPGWVLAVAGVMIASIWLGLFAFKHVEFSSELWWQVELQREAPRFLRGSVGAAVVLLLFGFARLIAPAPHEAVEPTDADLDTAAAIIAQQPSTFPNLVLLRDKTVVFNEGKTGFVMYGVQRSTWVALGDPVSPPEETSDLVRLFLERCDDFDGVPVFYEVGKNQLHHYANFGLAFVKLGEEAKVDLTQFTLEGGHAKKQRQILHRLEKSGAAFRIAPREETPLLMDRLRAVSDDWLQAKAGAEKGFSLGFFDPEYLSRFPVALIERGGDVLAFANVWRGAGNVELSVDLMRYRRDAPAETMEALLLQMMSTGKRDGYQWFALGMAPLSGFERSPVAPLWTRLGSFLYEHGEALYGFQGLRAYKEKFHPRWEPRYLVYPGGFRLPRILADVAALVAGGYRKILLK
jgi:phosphatidylglycerol lysyltransferase